MSKIQITTSGSVAWKEHKRRRALTSIVKSFILEEVDKPNVVCVDSRHSFVIVAPDAAAVVGGGNDGAKARRDVQVDQGDLPNPALRSSHGCEPSASHHYYQRFARQPNVGVGVGAGVGVGVGAPHRSYELQDVSLWIQEESEDSDLEGLRLN